MEKPCRRMNTEFWHIRVLPYRDFSAYACAISENFYLMLFSHEDFFAYACAVKTDFYSIR